ncbi:MAG: dihydroxyacetone kinase subunit L [bacterium]|nr:dihydroxyacetone kinase subunit L [bacterium]
MIELAQARTWIIDYAAEMGSRVEELNGLDAALADGDYGTSMNRGLEAAANTAETFEKDSIGELLKSIGMAMVSAMGGSSGPLVGTFFLRMGTSIGDVGETDVAGWAAGMRAGAEGIMALGGAAVGDKTMLDSLVPAIEKLEASTELPTQEALAGAAVTAMAAAEATADLAARRGRASYVGGGGVGHVDPGAMGVAIMFAQLEAAVN